MNCKNCVDFTIYDFETRDPETGTTEMYPGAALDLKSINIMIKTHFLGPRISEGQEGTFLGVVGSSYSNSRLHSINKPLKQVLGKFQLLHINGIYLHTSFTASY